MWFVKNWNRPASTLRSNVIYTLITDIKEGRNLEEAEKAYLEKVDPANYQRVKTLASKRQIEQAKKFIQEAGYQDSLFRVHAKITDIPEEFFLWKKTDIKTDEIDTLFSSIPTKHKEEVIKEGKKITVTELLNLIKDNKVTSLEVAQIDTMTAYLSTAKFKDAKPLFPWGHLAWTYSGGVADAVFKQVNKNVKNAGGNIDAKFKVSLAWFSCDDYDLHMITPKQVHIYYGNKKSNRTNWQLDVDMNAGGCDSETPVENIFTDMPEDGIYSIYVQNYYKRSKFKNEKMYITLQFHNKQFVVEYARRINHKEKLEICKFTLQNGQLTDIYFNPHIKILNDNNPKKYVNVLGILQSPNKKGLKHTFFILEETDKNLSGKEKGFFVEHLVPELKKHKRVLEILGDVLSFELNPTGVTCIGISENRKDLKLPIKINKVPYTLVTD